MKAHYITPYSNQSPPNIGGAINDAINRINPSDDDWIIHIDQDAMFLLPKDRAKLENALIDCDYDVVGTMTNRLNPNICGIQLADGMYNETDITKHIEYAKTTQDGFKPINIVALVCMAFRYSYWKKVGGFKENNPQLDIDFSQQGKCAIYTGVYVFHVYRLYSKTNDITHLIK